jgi:hypothetical protein
VPESESPTRVSIETAEKTLGARDVVVLRGGWMTLTWADILVPSTSRGAPAVVTRIRTTYGVGLRLVKDLCVKDSEALRVVR